MKFQETSIKNLHIIKFEPKIDERGSFKRIFCQRELASANLSFSIAQANLSVSRETGTIRGLHFQKPPMGEDKIVQCLNGKIYDCVIDLRPESPSYKKLFTCALEKSDQTALYIPKGCAHGFQTLTPDCEVLYFMSEFFSPEYYAGIRWNDPLFNIPWPLENPIVSLQDQNWPDFIP